MITINGLQIDDNINYLVEEIDYKNMPIRNIQIEAISTRPGNKMVAYEWAEKEITIKGRVFGQTYQDLNSLIDTLQKNFAVPFVDISIDTGKSFTGALSELTIPNQFYTLSMAQYEAKFICADPFAYGNMVTISGTTVSGTVTCSGVLTISGSAFAEPLLTLRPIGALAGNSGIQAIQIYNSSTGELVTVSGTFPYGSDITIDYANFAVTISGISSDFNGIFSRFEPGNVNYEITVTSGTRNAYQWKWSYRPRYYQ